MRNNSLNVLFEDDNILVVNKPYGLLTQGNALGDDSLVSQVETYLGYGAHLVNRLDRPVSGIVLFSKNDRTHRLLSSQSGMLKSYMALCHKSDRLHPGEWIQYHAHDKKSNRALISSTRKDGFKEVCLQIEHIFPLDHYDLVLLQITAGKFHQIRAQLSSLGAPIKGDVKYGARRKNDDREIMLHAYKFKVEQLNQLFVAPVPIDHKMWKLASEMMEAAL